MRRRTTLPTAAATALLAAVLAVPGQAMAAESTPAPTDSGTATASAAPAPTDGATATPTPTAVPTATATPTATVTPTATATAAPTDTGTPAPTGPPQVTTPTPGMPFAANAYPYLNNGMSVIAWDVTATGGEDIAAVTSVSLHFRLHGSPATAPDDAVVSGLTRYYPGSATWVTPGAVPLTKLGVYDVSAEVTNASGTTDLVPDVGQDTVAAVVTVTSLKANPGKVSYEQQQVTVTGHVTITDPSTGAALAPDRLDLSVGSSGLIDGGGAAPDANGDFSTLVTVGSGPTLTFSVSSIQGRGATPYRLRSSVTSNTVSVVQEPTRIRMLVPQNVYAKSGQVPLSGVVERQVGSSWLPVPDLSVMYDVDGAYTVTTGPGGVFKAVVPYFGRYQFRTSGDSPRYGTGNVYLTGSVSVPIHVHIPVPTYFNYLSYDESAIGQAEITAGISAEGGPGIPDNKLNVTVQYSTDNRTWHYVGLTRIGRPGVGSDTVQFWATYDGRANGYWRLYFPGTPDLAAAYSPAMHLSRVATSITGGRPSTAWAHRGQSVAFTGTLWQNRGHWSRMSHWRVALVFRPYGSTSWYYVTAGWTNSHGDFTLRGTATRAGTWATVFVTPDPSHLDAVGPMTYVHVS